MENRMEELLVKFDKWKVGIQMKVRKVKVKMRKNIMMRKKVMRQRKGLNGTPRCPSSPIVPRRVARMARRGRQ